VTPAVKVMLLEEQDRTFWDRAMIEEGEALLTATLAEGRPGPLQLWAAIAACHSTAADASQTDWRQISLLYSELLVYEPSPVVEANRAIAVAMAEGPAAGLTILDVIVKDPQLSTWPAIHIACADLLARAAGTNPRSTPTAPRSNWSRSRRSEPSSVDVFASSRACEPERAENIAQCCERSATSRGVKEAVVCETGGQRRTVGLGRRHDDHPEDRLARIRLHRRRRPDAGGRCRRVLDGTLAPDGNDRRVVGHHAAIPVGRVLGLTIRRASDRARGAPEHR
jgi:hypothetical protein